MKSFLLNTGLGIGENFPVRVCCNVGVNTKTEKNNELLKIDTVFKTEKFKPDIIMDLSTIDLKTPIYQIVCEKYGCTVGTVPTYYCFSETAGFDKKKLFYILKKQIELGVSFFTLHLTADMDLFDIAKKTRKLPVTSRGGGLIIADQFKKNKKCNILIECLDEIITISKKYEISISLGSTFRPASILDACDEVHLEETKRQLNYARFLQKKGINVIVENVGHITLDKLYQHINILKKFNAPIMPLGPLPTDIGFENDHIVSAIGASFLGYFNCAHIIHSITPDEHHKSKITSASMIKGIESAKIAAHIINISKGRVDLSEELNIYNKRAEKIDCILSERKCTRCGSQCPLKLGNSNERKK